MTDSITLLEGLTTETTVLFIALGLIGFVCLRVGWVAYTERTPRFVLHYTGWSCPPLAMLYGGIAMLIMGGLGPVTKLERLQATIPDPILGIIGLTWTFSGVTFLLGFFFWFPPFLVPPWYRRARKAGIDRHDPNAMGAFKALPLDQQRAAARRGA
ncbi:hypothetical protein EII34_05315 [Arachnia propionica]|uniref:Uncharacterized protein n=1 Tax=Arachnia propionica TaxID=1750 RepID=A0A3P1T9J1_9ACTN|nr:hypothetical protein [Arachnia propionica]MDO5084582.1 hypothetical protein [Arachnia propionica]RRD06104.1 hypothetical protein EII34_05315 [Arachnia propionica]